MLWKIDDSYLFGRLLADGYLDALFLCLIAVFCFYAMVDCFLCGRATETWTGIVTQCVTS